MKALLKRSQFITAIARSRYALRKDLQKMRWVLERKPVIRRYLSAPGSKKLIIGAGKIALPGWLSTDITPNDAGVVHLDATERFPFPDNTFDYIYSEHMIEHIDHASAKFMLRECYRVLKGGAKIRVATPDLGVLVGLLGERKTREQQHYIDWIVDNCIPGVTYCSDIFVLNNAFYNWGHKFLFDRTALKNTLEECGFVDLREFAPGESDDDTYRGIESHGQDVGAEDINQFETQVWEGVVRKAHAARNTGATA